MAENKRVYEVCENATGKSRLVLATSPAQAVRHVVKSNYSVGLPSQEALIRLGGEGVKMETAGAEDAVTP